MTHRVYMFILPKFKQNPLIENVLRVATESQGKLNGNVTRISSKRFIIRGYIFCKEAFSIINFYKE